MVEESCFQVERYQLRLLEQFWGLRTPFLWGVRRRNACSRDFWRFRFAPSRRDFGSSDPLIDIFSGGVELAPPLRSLETGAGALHAQAVRCILPVGREMKTEIPAEWTGGILLNVLRLVWAHLQLALVSRTRKEARQQSPEQFTSSSPWKGLGAHPECRKSQGLIGN
jgi:hypothetical protein